MTPIPSSEPAGPPKRALVCGAGGFIGGHLVRRLKREGYWVRGADRKPWGFGVSPADDFALLDLRDAAACAEVLDHPFDEVYHFAADMGGAGFVFTGEHDAEILHSNAQITLNLVPLAAKHQVGRFFFASSACIYPAMNQDRPDAAITREDSAYPADPDSDYGWEKLFGERLCLAFHRNHGLNVRIARLHNVFGPEGAWRGGREKAPAALCRKVAEAVDGTSVDLWGDGQQTRSFLYIDECLDGLRRLMNASVVGPLNLGSSEQVTLDELCRRVIAISGKRLEIHHVPGPQGVRGRTSDNTLIQSVLGWAPSGTLDDGLARTYAWVAGQVAQRALLPSEER
jgi:GDP-D-mannose 3',5'-epimerase